MAKHGEGKQLIFSILNISGFLVWRFFLEFTLPETHSKSPENRPSQKEASIFQQSILRCENVSFREGTWRIIPGLVSGDRITPIYKP